nr:hypothetical protein [Tanacetum cinerariifolium]
MLSFMLSPSDSIFYGGGGTDGGSDGGSALDLLRDEDDYSNESSRYRDGGSGLDLLRDEDGNSNESSGCRIRLAGRDWVGDG